jgi:hypothetical protein
MPSTAMDLEREAELAALSTVRRPVGLGRSAVGT